MILQASAMFYLEKNILPTKKECSLYFSTTDNWIVSRGGGLLPLFLFLWGVQKGYLPGNDNNRTGEEKEHTLEQQGLSPFKQ